MSKIPHDIIKLIFDNYVDARTKYRMSMMSKRYYNRKNMYNITLAAMKQKSREECEKLYRDAYVCLTCGNILKSKMCYNRHMEKHKKGKIPANPYCVKQKKSIVGACNICGQNKISNLPHKCWSLTIPCIKQTAMFRNPSLKFYDIICPRDPDFYHSPVRHKCLAICKACDTEVLNNGYEGALTHLLWNCQKVHTVPREYISTELFNLFSLTLSDEGAEKFENDYQLRKLNNQNIN